MLGRKRNKRISYFCSPNKEPMEIAKTFDPKSIEKKWYDHWIKNEFFRSVPDDREAYTIVIPPPNVTGVLHMGHMLNNTIQDVLIRRARMQGFNACWVPGTDHASIATEAKVVKKLREQGITKADITRDEFLKHAFDWKEEYGGIIIDQLKKLGASCDWDRTRFTMEESLSKAVVKVFVDLFNKGYLYRDLKMVNWDPAAQTTLSNEEVIHKEEQSNLYHVRYSLVGSDETITIATTRPETILGDTAICVHPEDERYQQLKGAKAIVPLVERVIPIIFDEYVDREFGTGALKVTPAHDVNDYDLGQKHGLETIDIMNPDGTLSEAAQLYVGEDRMVVRKKLVADLKANGNLVEIEQIQNKVGYSERNPDTIVEPRLSLQWFVDMQKIAPKALESVISDEIEFFPAKFKNTYRHWMENIRDWPISRQLWWGQQIPAYYLEDGTVIVAETQEDALAQAREKTGDSNLALSALRQDEDVVDTWFSSWLWPISVFDGFEDTNELDYYYPTNVLVTGWDIIFFWVARMIMAGYEFKGERPFKHVYFTGMVRDKQRRKMSKSLGNSPDALGLIDQYGADGVRVGMLLSAAAGNDLLFDEKLCEQGRNFSNKIWNALRLVSGWETDDRAIRPAEKAAHEWFRHRFQSALKEVEQSFADYRLSEALMNLYKLVWDDFCSWYLEMVKPPYGEAISASSKLTIQYNFQLVIKLLHPFMPFLTEEVYHQLALRDEKDCITVSDYPEQVSFNGEVVSEFEKVKEVVSAIRSFRQEKGISPKEELTLFVNKNEVSTNDFDVIIRKLGNVNSLNETDTRPDGSFSFRVGANEYAIPLEGRVDVAAEIEKLKEELKYQKGFLLSVEKKLSNERFVNNAPDQVVAVERKKQADAELKIKVLSEQLESLS